MLPSLQAGSSATVVRHIGHVRSRSNHVSTHWKRNNKKTRFSSRILGRRPRKFTFVYLGLMCLFCEPIDPGPPDNRISVSNCARIQYKLESIM